MPCPLDERDETANLYTVVCLVVRLWVPPLSLGPLGSCYSSVKGFFDLFSVDHRCRSAARARAAELYCCLEEETDFWRPGALRQHYSSTLPTTLLSTVNVPQRQRAVASWGNDGAGRKSHDSRLAASAGLPRSIEGAQEQSAPSGGGEEANDPDHTNEISSAE